MKNFLAAAKSFSADEQADKHYGDEESPFAILQTHLITLAFFFFSVPVN
jgi:hypothetical protein